MSTTRCIKDERYLLVILILLSLFAFLGYLNTSPAVAQINWESLDSSPQLGHMTESPAIAAEQG